MRKVKLINNFLKSIDLKTEFKMVEYEILAINNAVEKLRLDGNNENVLRGYAERLKEKVEQTKVLRSIIKTLELENSALVEEMDLVSLYDSLMYVEGTESELAEKKEVIKEVKTWAEEKIYDSRNGDLFAKDEQLFSEVKDTYELNYVKADLLHTECTSFRNYLETKVGEKELQVKSNPKVKVLKKKDFEQSQLELKFS